MCQAFELVDKQVNFGTRPISVGLVARPFVTIRRLRTVVYALLEVSKEAPDESAATLLLRVLLRCPWEVILEKHPSIHGPRVGIAVSDRLLGWCQLLLSLIIKG